MPTNLNKPILESEVDYERALGFEEIQQDILNAEKARYPETFRAPKNLTMRNVTLTNSDGTKTEFNVKPKSRKFSELNTMPDQYVL